jgi:hypothetical protein
MVPVSTNQPLSFLDPARCIGVLLHPPNVPWDYFNLHRSYRYTTSMTRRPTHYPFGDSALRVTLRG